MSKCALERGRTSLQRSPLTDGPIPPIGCGRAGYSWRIFWKSGGFWSPLQPSQAARRASPRQLEQLSGVLSAFTEAYSKRDLTRLTFYEEKFHLLIVEAAQNALLVRLYRELLDLLRAYTSHTCALERSFADALEPHRRIFAAIQSRDEDQAEFEMLSHLMLSSRHFQQSALESADRGDDSSHG